jgi:LemA protein
MWIVATLILLIAAIAALVYKRAISTQNRMDDALGELDAQLTRRQELVSNLTTVAKGYLGDDPPIFKEIARVCNLCIKVGNLSEKGRVETELSCLLRKFLALADSNAELKADVKFRKLRENLAGIEAQIEWARRSFIKAAGDYNNRMQTFPYSMLAEFLSFQHEKPFEMEYTAEPKIPSEELD